MYRIKPGSETSWIAQLGLRNSVIGLHNLDCETLLAQLPGLRNSDCATFRIAQLCLRNCFRQIAQLAGLCNSACATPLARLHNPATTVPLNKSNPHGT